MSAPMTPHEPPPPGGWPPPETGVGGPDGSADAEPLGTEVRRAALVALGLAVAGVLLGLLWLWLAPRIPLFTDGKAVYVKNPESEEAIGADGTFVLLGLGFGALSALVVFWLFRRGGIPLVVGTAVGGLLGSVVAWQLGAWLGPADAVEQARALGKGAVFDSPLELQAKGALLAWPIAGALVHLAMTALFGPRDPEPTHPMGY
ncbi:hypothetical protein ACFYYR_22175 [Streptomyces sp. NPDC001922]|uniref:hypothetical protein n=1 Tax=Streptomyces sp. NPDC001922 TaxID=3364624 RepID=UPI0036D1B474